ncbi:hypothetical protein [Absidia glauca]|uniref:Translation initiation factor eIF2B subunit alpha n=1 Tax=Absidia glauca TaxID=4829 RepID=A0A168P131_ABSGL|nr:hypothetical protein [Absidia glauca]
MAYYEECLCEEKEPSISIIRSLTEFVRRNSAPTMSEFMTNLSQVKTTLQEHTRKSVGMLAGHDLFMALFTHYAQEYTEAKKGAFEHFKGHVLNRTRVILHRLHQSQWEAAQLAAQFINDMGIVLVPVPCMAIMKMLDHAYRVENKRFKVLMAEGGPEGQGLRAVQELQALGIPCQVILDSAIGYIMDRVDVIYVGAQGVVENGGIINQVGTYQTALVAKTLGKPVYVIAESYKFVRMYPLNQYDLPSVTPEIVDFVSLTRYTTNPPLDLVSSNPSIDYTPPQYLTLLFTDLGVLTPSGVSDELIKLYL